MIAVGMDFEVADPQQRVKELAGERVLGGSQTDRGRLFARISLPCRKQNVRVQLEKTREPYTGINDAGYSINLRSFERLLTGDFYDGTIHFHLCAYFLQLCCQCRDCCFQFLNFAMLFKKLIE